MLSLLFFFFQVPKLQTFPLMSLSTCRENKMCRKTKGKLSFTFPETWIQSVSLRLPAVGAHLPLGQKGHLIGGGFPYTCPLPLVITRQAELYFKGPEEKDKQVTRDGDNTNPRVAPARNEWQMHNGTVIKGPGATAELSRIDRDKGRRDIKVGRESMGEEVKYDIQRGNKKETGVKVKGSVG